MNELITCKAAAEMIGIPPRTFTGYVADGTIPPECVFRLKGKRPRIRKAVFERMFSLGIEAAKAAENANIFAPLRDQ